MRKITLFFVVTLLTMVANSQIWVAPITKGSPINTQNIYVGDKLLTDTYFQFKIGQESWNASEVGIGQNTDGTTDWSWAGATWYEDGEGMNKKVQRNLKNFQFTATGSWYVTGRAKAGETDDWTYSEELDWTDDQIFMIENCSYYTVSELQTPTSTTATTYSASQINLAWTKFAGKDVLVVARKSSVAEADAPITGAIYNVGDELGTGKVVYRGGGESTSISDLEANTEYVFTLYSENWTYYSAGTNLSAKTLSPAWDKEATKVTINGTEYTLNQLASNTTDLGTVTKLEINGVLAQYRDGNTEANHRTGADYYYVVQKTDDPGNIIDETTVNLTQSSLGINLYQGADATTTNLINNTFKPNTKYNLHIWFKSYNGESGGDILENNDGMNYLIVFTTSNDIDTATEDLQFNSFISAKNGKIYARFDGIAKIQVFNIAGQMLTNTVARGEFSQKVAQGIYIVRINDKTQKIVIK